MKTLYIDASAGAAGDMLMGALYALSPERDSFLTTMNSLPLPGLEIRPEPEADGVRLSVRFHGMEEEVAPHVYTHHNMDGVPHVTTHHNPDGAPHVHTHRDLAGVLALIRALPLPDPVREDARAVYELLAGAEAEAHGVPVGAVHFHEVGMDDAITDIAGVSLLLHGLAPDEIVCSPVAVGSGTVRCAHGELPVPAPAAAALLRGLPTCPGPGPGELCTPTGAALLRRFVTRFGELPEPDAPSLGYGSRRFPTHRNAVRVWLARS